LINTIRSLSGQRRKPYGIVADLQGPKIRTGTMPEGGVTVEKGDTVEITTDEVLGRPGLIPTTYSNLPADAKPGGRLLINDGAIELKVISISGNTVTCKVIAGGQVGDHKGINLPGTSVSAPSLTEKDREDLDFCLDIGVDFVALSFVRKASDIEELKRIISDRGMKTPVIAKIEKPEAIRNLAGVVEAADAVMVARGDLGVELRPEKVPLVQKKIIKLCNSAGKPVITATQMLESMINHHMPTRAETSDVANAILDGTDAVMLSGETAVGQYPIESVATMVKVANDVESSQLLHIPSDTTVHSSGMTEAVAEAACLAASALKAKAIVVFTQSGSTAALVSKIRPNTPIVAITPSNEIERRMTIYWGIKTGAVPSMEGTDRQVSAMETALLENGFRRGDLVVITMGAPVAERCPTNLMKVHRLGMETT
jgi:pyruvate kinase